MNLPPSEGLKLQKMNFSYKCILTFREAACEKRPNEQKPHEMVRSTLPSLIQHGLVYGPTVKYFHWEGSSLSQVKWKYN